MSETSFILFYQIVAGTECVLYAVSMAMFFRSFMNNALHAGRRKKASFLIFALYTICYSLCLFSWFSGWMHMVLVTALLMLLSGFLGIERSFVFLLGVLFHCIRTLSLMIMRSLDFLTGEWFLRNADTPEQVFCNAACNHLLIAALQFLLFSLMLHLTGRLLKRGSMQLHAIEICCLLLTPVTGILFANVIVRLLIVISEDHIFRLYERFPAFLGIIPAAAVLFYLGILAAIAAWQRITALQAEQKKYLVARQQLGALQERIREMEQLHDSVRRMKHEMKNHLTNIKGLAESGHYRDMETYIARMNDSMKILELTIHTGNAVTDVIINDRQKEAAALGIEFQCEFVYPASDRYNAYDIGIILGNLLQNALEACQKMAKSRKYITLSGRQKRRFFLIEVTNSFEGTVLFNQNTGLPVSDRQKTGPKTALSLHGIGLSNVKREVEKYMGDLDIKIDGSEFHVTVLLQESPNVNCNL